MGQLLTKLNSLVQEEDIEVVVDEKLDVPSTPTNMRPANFDPRSPETADIIRTPIVITDTSQPQQSSFDPRSPCPDITRTPLEIKRLDKNLQEDTEDYVNEENPRLNIDWNESMTPNDSMIAVCGSLNNISASTDDLLINDTREDDSENMSEHEQKDVTDNKEQAEKVFETKISTPLKESGRTSNSSNDKSPFVVHNDNTTPKSVNRDTPNKHRVVLGAIDKNSPLKLVQRKQAAKLDQQLICPSPTVEFSNAASTDLNKQVTY